MKSLKIFGLFLALLTFGFAIKGSELVVKSLLNGKIELKVPSKFTIMSDELMKLKYPMNQRPNLVFTNDRASINVAINLTENHADQGLIEGYKDNMVQTFKSAYPEAKWVNNGVKEINGRKVGFIELITPAVDTEVYNLMFFTDLDGQLLLCSFNCIVKNQKEWSPKAHEIMNSLNLIELEEEE